MSSSIQLGWDAPEYPRLHREEFPPVDTRAAQVASM